MIGCVFLSILKTLSTELNLNFTIIQFFRLIWLTELFFFDANRGKTIGRQFPNILLIGWIPNFLINVRTNLCFRSMWIAWLLRIMTKSKCLQLNLRCCGYYSYFVLVYCVFYPSFLFNASWRGMVVKFSRFRFYYSTNQQFHLNK